MATKKELQKPEVNSEYLKFNHLNPNKFSNIIRKWCRSPNGYISDEPNSKGRKVYQLFEVPNMFNFLESNSNIPDEQTIEMVQRNAKANFLHNRILMNNLALCRREELSMVSKRKALFRKLAAKTRVEAAMPWLTTSLREAHYKWINTVNLMMPFIKKQGCHQCNRIQMLVEGTPAKSNNKDAISVKMSNKVQRLFGGTPTKSNNQP